MADSERETVKKEKKEDAVKWLKEQPDRLCMYAALFLDDRVTTFKKDMAICLTPDNNRSHAYMPALMNCISLLELLSGLHAGNIKSPDPARAWAYGTEFMGHITGIKAKLVLLFEMFRHKVAHVTQPYGVFDPDGGRTAGKFLTEQGWRRVTWTVSEKMHLHAIAVTPEEDTLVVRPPWPLEYEHRCTISLPRLAGDIVASALSENGYLRSLPGDLDAQGKFADCMGEFFPPGVNWKRPAPRPEGPQHRPQPENQGTVPSSLLH